MTADELSTQFVNIQGELKSLKHLSVMQQIERRKRKASNVPKNSLVSTSLAKVAHKHHRPLKQPSHGFCRDHVTIREAILEEYKNGKENQRQPVEIEDPAWNIGL
jgi:hypothetical protein